MKRQAPKRRKESTAAENESVSSEVAVQTDAEVPERNTPPEHVEIKMELPEEPDDSNEELPQSLQTGPYDVGNPVKRQLAALESGFLADVTIIVGDEEIKCHSLVVSFASPKLAVMLKENEPRLPDVDPRHFRLLLQIIYGGETSEMQDLETLLQVGRLAHDLKVRAAVAFCAECIDCKLDTENVFSILDFAELIQNPELIEACFKIFRNNAGHILQTDGFLNCTGTRIKSILSQEVIYNVTELQLFQACVAWTNANLEQVEKRRATLSSAFHLIRFRLFSAEEFAENVSPIGLLRAEDERDIFRSCATGKNFMPVGFSQAINSRDPSQVMVLKLRSSADRKPSQNSRTSLLMYTSRDIFIHGVKLLAFRSDLPDGCLYDEHVKITMHGKMIGDYESDEASFRGQARTGEMICVKFKHPIEMNEDYGYYYLHVVYGETEEEHKMSHVLYKRDFFKCETGLEMKLIQEFMAPPGLHLIVGDKH